jgi:hypothetical protein
MGGLSLWLRFWASIFASNRFNSEKAQNQLRLRYVYLSGLRAFKSGWQSYMLLSGWAYTCSWFSKSPSHHDMVGGSHWLGLWAYISSLYLLKTELRFCMGGFFVHRVCYKHMYLFWIFNIAFFPYIGGYFALSLFLGMYLFHEYAQIRRTNFHGWISSLCLCFRALIYLITECTQTSVTNITWLAFFSLSLLVSKQQLFEYPQRFHAACSALSIYLIFGHLQKRLITTR